MFFTFTQPNLATALDELTALLDDSKKEVAALLAQPDKNFHNFVRPYQHIFEKIEWFFTPLSILNSTKNDETIQEVYEAMLPLLSDFDSDVKQDPALFEVFKTICKNEANLTHAQKKLLENEILDFELTGASLDEAQKSRMKAISSRLSQLANTFSQNVLNATNAYELILESDRDIKEMSESDRAQARKKADGKTFYRFTLKGPSFTSFMTYCSNPQLREQMYKAYVTRAPENDSLMEEILALRAEKASLLGFENYAALSVKTKMARNPEEVEHFLTDLAHQSRPQAIREFDRLRAFAAKEGCAELNSFDTGYYAKKLEKASFDLDEEHYRPYFEKQSVVAGLFEFLYHFFGITFEQIEERAWDAKTATYLLKRNSAPFAKIYMDLESRDEKQGGAWMGDWRTHAKTPDGTTQLPIAYIVCNFSPSSDTLPSLLRHDDVVTLFHEMGHALHHLLSTVEEPFVSGIAGVEWDAVEFPSQFLENFA
jgi:oligopeptidase A